MFDVKLFLELCEEHNIPLASTSGKCQILRNDIPSDLMDEDVEQILSYYSEHSQQSNVIISSLPNQYYTLGDELLPAC